MVSSRPAAQIPNSPPSATVTRTVRVGTSGPTRLDCANSRTVRGMVAAPTSSTVGSIVGFRVSSMITNVATYAMIPATSARIHAKRRYQG